VCMDILNDEWMASMSVRSILISIQSLLSAPDADNPINFIAAEQLKMNKTIFEAKVKE
jgi:ubiquitin-protein ligase